MTALDCTIAAARSHVGVSESPAGSNRQPFSTALGRPPEAWCFTAGTLISTPDGLVPIEDVQAGDLVLNAQGHPRTVTATNERPSPVVLLRALGLDGTRASPEHPYLTRRLVARKRRNIYGEPEWVPVGELQKGDLIAEPILGGDEPADVARAYILGRYIADGWTTTVRTRVSGEPRDRRFLCDSFDEAEAIEKALDLARLGFKRREYRTVTQFSLHDDSAELLKEAGRGAETKRVPGHCMRWHREAREALLRGYLDGDGSERDGLVRATSVSRQLTIGIAMLARSVGYLPAVYGYARPTEGWIEGRLVRRQPMVYEVHFRRSGQSPQIHRGDGCLWAPVRKVEPDGEAIVYNLTVDGEHTFIADGVAVHNCADFLCYCDAIDCSLDFAWLALGLMGTPSCRVITDNAKRKGRFGSEPRVGAWVMFGPYGGSHVERVLEVRADGIVSIGGNTSAPNNYAGGTVAQHFRRFGPHDDIYGYVYPPYTDPAPVPQPTQEDEGMPFIVKKKNDPTAWLVISDGIKLIKLQMVDGADLRNRPDGYGPVVELTDSAVDAITVG